MGATYQKRGKKSWRVTVHWKGQREIKTVHSEQDAKALVQYIHKQELAGINVIEAIRKAREAAAPEAPTYPRLRDAISTWIEAQESAGAIRPSTSRMYRGRCERWLYTHALRDGRHLGDLPVNLVTREMLGAVIQAIKSAGRSMSLVKGVRNPVRSYYANLIETKTFPGPNPAGDLAFFLKGVKRPTKITAFFTQEEGPKLVETAKALYPRWSVFILTGLLAGLRWGESAGLYKSDIDFKRGRIHVQRTVSEGRRTTEGRRDAVGQGEPGAPRSVTRSRGEDRARGPGPGLDGGATSACLPQHARPRRQLLPVPREGLAAASGEGEAPVPPLSRHATHLRHLAAERRGRSQVGPAAARPREHQPDGRHLRACPAGAPRGCG
jgi:hypothetical protein